MALSSKSEAIQLSGLCPCQHRVPDFRAMIEESNADLVAAGFSPIPLKGAK